MLFQLLGFLNRLITDILLEKVNQQWQHSLYLLITSMCRLIIWLVGVILRRVFLEKPCAKHEAVIE